MAKRTTKTFKIEKLPSYKAFNEVAKQAIAYKKQHPKNNVCIVTPRMKRYCVVAGKKTAYKVRKAK